MRGSGLIAVVPLAFVSVVDESEMQACVSAFWQAALVYFLARAAMMTLCAQLTSQRADGAKSREPTQPAAQPEATLT